MEEELIKEKEDEFEEPKEKNKVIDEIMDEIKEKLDKRDALILKQKEWDIKHADEQVTETKEKWDKGMADFPEEFEFFEDFKGAREVIEKYDRLLKQIRDELEILLRILSSLIKELEKCKIKNKKELEKLKEKNKEKQEEINRLEKEINKLKKAKKIYKENQKLKEKKKKQEKEFKKQEKELIKKYKIKIRKLNIKLKEIKKRNMGKKDYKISPKMEEVYRRYNAGETQKKIAEEIGKNEHTINRWIQKVKISNEQKGLINKKITSKIQEKV